MLSYGGAVIALIMTGPSVLFGAIAKNTDWDTFGFPAPEGDCSKVRVSITDLLGQMATRRPGPGIAKLVL